ncbi:acetyl-CoA synthetase-like protein [Gloeophyllum trabeum ATCC 11539]|uniref:Acetyl-CoA synthetase-like protein n=1 Tax=Gloeophyllum trabeum (strain ATCC 11539 / FP-39264 / Madison 617) TaxID=670483 RepID=S7QGW8_GLOTA|nr:acetyl-CoA synthetase-like protein [Gloeophyllum trabeum ATCC 11539]EPQ59006.1 acetyl-CoA synthetase-like protein [Gloeophyllum trabeum ATCC 11539]
MYDWHYENSPNHRLFIFAREDGTIQTIYWFEAVQALYVCAKLVRDRMDWQSGRNTSQVIAILAPSVDSIPYFMTVMAIMYAGYIAFPVSPRNSPAAIAHLISKTDIKHILVGREKAMEDLARESLGVLKAHYSGVAIPETSLMFLFEELFLPSPKALKREDVPYDHKDPDEIAVILHSSGSTAFPKPVHWTQHRLLQMSLIPWFGERDLTNQVWSLHAMPMYHGMGACQIFWTATTGHVLAYFEPKSPAPTPTPDSLFDGARKTNSDVIFCVPSFVEVCSPEWAKNPDYVEWLSTRTGVLTGGGPLNKECGDYLTSQGVSIFILYGATEGGMMSTVLPGDVGYDWEYFKFPGLVTPHMVPQGDGKFEFVMVENAVCTPSVINTKVGGVDAYATSDLFVPHPTMPEYWKVFGRSDDQIIHNTGEKLVVILRLKQRAENMLNQDPHVLTSVMFGRGRFQAGVLIDPKPRYKFVPSDESKLAEYRNMIWPTIEKMNAYAPQHSRLFKEMITVSKPSKPFTYTAKNTLRRQVIIYEYQDEIDALYAKLEESTQSSIPPPADWDLASATEFVRAVVNKVLIHGVEDGDDIFHHGCDSLQATWIRNSLLRALHDSAHINTMSISHNFVYDHPSIHQLSLFLKDTAAGTNSQDGASVAFKAETMRRMAEEFSTDFHVHTANGNSVAPPASVVLLTGSTGSLGCHILTSLVLDPDVQQVYALNRAAGDGTALVLRQKQALLDRGFHPSILDSPKVILVEGKDAEKGLGLEPRLYQEVRIIRTPVFSAWRVDFNIALNSFKPNIGGLRNLIDLSLKEPVKPEIAVGTGYTESKWVSEEILLKAAAHTALDPMIVRVGQVCGGSDGAWNVQEWFPSIVQSGPILKCLPEDQRVVTWIPTPLTAAAIIDFHKAPSVPRIVHLIHPRPVSLSSLMDTLSKELNVPIVPYADWLGRLEAVAESSSKTSGTMQTVDDIVRRLRATRLLPFFKSLREAPGGNAFGFPDLSSTNAVSASATLADDDLESIGPADVKNWLAYWSRSNLFS